MARFVAAGDRADAGPGRQARTLLAAAVLSACLMTSCKVAENTPEQVANQFIAGLQSGSRDMLEGLFAWEDVAIRDYYVDKDYLDSLEPEKKNATIDEFKKTFYEDYVPLAKKARYTLEKVYIARDVCDVIISVSFPGKTTNRGEPVGPERLRISLRLDREKKHWYIIDLGDFFSLNMLRGDYNPGKLYLPGPSLP